MTTVIEAHAVVPPKQALAQLSAQIAAWLDYTAEGQPPTGGEVADIVGMWLPPLLAEPITKSIQFVVEGMASGRFSSPSSAAADAAVELPAAAQRTLFDLIEGEGG